VPLDNGLICSIQCIVECTLSAVNHIRYFQDKSNQNTLSALSRSGLAINAA